MSSDAERHADTIGKRTRGKSKQENWRRSPDDGLAVIALELDAADGRSQNVLFKHFRAAFELRRALQHDARTRCQIYWRSRRERKRTSPKKVRDRLGLSRAGFEALAKRYVEGAPKLAAHVTKAMALHMADSVWQAARRNLHADSSGRRAGLPRVGRFYDFTRIPGRARSHTTQNKWETYRLHGTLQGHLDTYRAEGLDAPTVADVLALEPGVRVLDQPNKMRPPKLTARSWHEHTGALCMVVNLPGGELVLPVRLPSGAGRWARLWHFLEDPETWHKVDLVRVQDHRAHGGWRYEAHLAVLKEGYQSPAECERRAAVQLDRRAGADANVSNVTVASIAADGTDLRAGRLDLSEHDKQAALVRQRKRTRAQRRLDRSRRATNPGQYELSDRQKAHNRQREARGLEPVQFGLRKGPRVANKNGVPKRAYRKDDLSHAYLTQRAEFAEEAAGTSRAKRDRARTFAAQLVGEHGGNLIVEDVYVANWMRLWGKRIALFSPGMIIAALRRETRACGGRTLKAGTRQTKMSQTCLCGAEVRKTLDDRVHTCPACGLVCDRDQVSSILAACTRFTDPDDPGTARIDPTLARAVHKQLIATCSTGQQEGPARSTAHPPATRRPRLKDPTGHRRAEAAETPAQARKAAPLPRDVAANTATSNLPVGHGPPGEL